MKKIILSLFITALVLNVSKAQIYMGKECTVSFFSKTTMEDIDAKESVAQPILNSTTGDIAIKIPTRSFIFKDGLMAEHFYENFVESHKFPNAIFKGKINEKIDYSKNGDHKVTVTGEMDLHGVKKTITISGDLKIKDGVVHIYSKFNIKMADYDIKDPTIIGKSVAESIDVTITATLAPYTKKK